VRLLAFQVSNFSSQKFMAQQLTAGIALFHSKPGSGTDERILL
jgi:hypothetical protein